MSVQTTPQSTDVRPSVAAEHERLATLPQAPLLPLGLRGVLRRGFTYWRPHWALAIPILLMMFVQEGFNTFFDLKLQQIIDHVLIDQDGPLLVQILAQILGFYLLANAAAVVGNYLSARVGARILNDLRRQMFTHLQRLSMGYFANARSGDVIARFTSDLAEVDKGLTYRFTDGHLSVIGLLLNVPALFLLQWQLALATLAALPLAMLGGRLFAARAARAFLRLKREQAAMASAVQENVKAQAVIRIFGLQWAMLIRLQRQLADLFQVTASADFLSMLVGTSSSFGVKLVAILVIGLGAFVTFNGGLSIGTLVAFVALANDVCRDAYDLSKKVTPRLIAAGGGVQRIEELLNEQPQVVDAPDAGSLPRLARAIRFEDVSFSYTGQQAALNHVSFTIPAGHYVAFVGPTGAGKSTILNLLARFYDPTSGNVTFDGHDLRTVTQDSLRAQMGAVFQDTFLFNTTIRENIRLGRLGSTDAEVEVAAQAAEIDDFIAHLPDGYDTRVGEMGSLLSGGQRQRLAIARAILRDPAILLLDEPTSDLDPVTEAAINLTLRRLARERTVIAVTHRLGAIQQADEIFVLDRGWLVEHGRHHDLIATQGIYFELSRDGSRPSLTTSDADIPRAPQALDVTTSPPNAPPDAGNRSAPEGRSETPPDRYAPGVAAATPVASRLSALRANRFAGLLVLVLALALGVLIFEIVTSVRTVNFAPETDIPVAAPPGATVAGVQTRAVAEPTLVQPRTAVPTPTAHPALSPTAGPRILLDESFSNGAPGWPNAATSSAFWDSLGYHLVPRVAGQHVAVAAPVGTSLADVIVTGLFRKSGGPIGGGYGLVLRAQGATLDGVNQGGRYYVFEVGDRGEVGVWRREQDHWVDLLPWIASRAVHPGIAENRLDVRATGSQFTFSVNDAQVAQVTDATLASGAVGVFTGGDGNQVLLERFTATAL